MRLGILLLGGFGVATVLAQGQLITPKEVKSKVGQLVTLSGKVASFGCSDEGSVLNLEQPKGSHFVNIHVPRQIRPGFGSRLEDRYLFREIEVDGIVEEMKGSTKWYRVVVDDPRSLRITAEPLITPTVFQPGTLRDCDEGVRRPRLLARANPQYPAAPLNILKTGTVILQAVVLTDGGVGEVGLIRSLDAALDAQAVMALKRWRFQPASLGGQPVPVIVVVEMYFNR